ncbi:DNA-processing protein DprA [Pseudobacteriovorax antillogorgiicola]|uniref:DNA protecting protein DprA n=1 Tax=Pseudobacteriovorax antillogorgiicola TaxID=1513793 RepID=A0A1Y6C684_9BACT|nr:DNA-processing protein DprA [Pseudobacteriovorax antillogorgiicola]TCS49473.1 DNA protecting protein DprA [Pseudobacteriovorax antillogorgiicola]SMF46213.1 DNA protecting protein DprA [Pseudobacteriovorax antillogorgiicola]
MNILDTTLCHIVSQLTYKWIPIGDEWESTSTDVLHTIPWLEWRRYIRCEQNRGTPWGQVLHKHLDGAYDVVLKELEILMTSIKQGYHYLSICDPRYPYLLRQIKDAPFGLSYRGNLDALHNPCLAIVGSRKAAVDAVREAQDLAMRLAYEGATIVSGGAIGCDTAAHLGALCSGVRPSPTIAVMAGSIDKLYPRCNDVLFHRILEYGGMIISERLTGTQPRPMDFPIRNRIISGIANRVLLMQAANRSGAMSTANLALAQGRDVMVYEPRRTDVRFTGNQALMEQGAPWFSSADDYFQLKWE